MLDLRTIQPLYGPSFNGKCMFGINKLTYRSDDAFNYQLGFTPVYNTILSFTETTGSSVSYGGNVFCMGRSAICYEYLGTLFDEYTSKCYVPATCPLTRFPVWTSRNICPRCADNVCHTCDALTRKICSGCHGYLFAVLNTTSKKCQCKVNYMPITYPTKPG